MVHWHALEHIEISDDGRSRMLETYEIDTAEQAPNLVGRRSRVLKWYRP